MAKFKNYFLRKRIPRGASPNNSDDEIEKYEYGYDHTTGRSPQRHHSKSSWGKNKRSLSDVVKIDDQRESTQSTSLTRSSRSLEPSNLTSQRISISQLSNSGSGEIEEKEDGEEEVEDEFDDEFDMSHIEKAFGKKSFALVQTNETRSANDRISELSRVSDISPFSGKSNIEDDNLSKDEPKGDDQELDRATVRLDGIEVYAIVSALTCATSISCFDNFEATPIAVIIQERAVFTLISELLYYLSGAIGMLTGLHATLIFSLVTMYGRTALGIDRDDAFNAFFAGTGAARFNGFRSFKKSLYCFMTQLSFLIAKKFVFVPLRPVVLLIAGYYSYYCMYFDSESVLKTAGVIYSSPAPEPEDVDPDDRRSAMGTLRKRRSSASKSVLTTRTFGVDTRKSNESERRSFINNFGTSFYGK